MPPRPRGGDGGRVRTPGWLRHWKGEGGELFRAVFPDLSIIKSTSCSPPPSRVPESTRKPRGLKEEGGQEMLTSGFLRPPRGARVGGGGRGQGRGREGPGSREPTPAGSSARLNREGIRHPSGPIQSRREGGREGRQGGRGRQREGVEEGKK